MNKHVIVIIIHSRFNVGFQECLYLCCILQEQLIPPFFYCVYALRAHVARCTFFGNRARRNRAKSCCATAAFRVFITFIYLLAKPPFDLALLLPLLFFFNGTPLRY